MRRGFPYSGPGLLLSLAHGERGALQLIGVGLQRAINPAVIIESGCSILAAAFCWASLSSAGLGSKRTGRSPSATASASICFVDGRYCGAKAIWGFLPCSFLSWW